MGPIDIPPWCNDYSDHTRFPLGVVACRVAVNYGPIAAGPKPVLLHEERVNLERAVGSVGRECQHGSVDINAAVFQQKNHIIISLKPPFQ
jgi:hypothetical protein